MANLPTTNNNPGDLREAGQANSSTGAGGFASFKTPQDGYAALANDLQAKINAHPEWDLGKFSTVYAPPSDNNDTAEYTAKLANQLGVPPNTPISQLQGKMGQFVQAIASNEGFNGVQSVKPQPAAQSSSNTPNLDAALGIGGLLAAGGLTAAALFQGGADVPNDVAAGAADAAVAPSLFSKVSSFFGNAAKTGAEGAVIDQGLNALEGGSGQSGASQTTTPQPTSNPQSAPANESVTPEQGLPAPQAPFQEVKTPEELEAQLPQANQNTQQAASGLQSMMQSTQKGRVMGQDPLYQAGIGANSRYGNIGVSDENGNYDASGTAEKANSLLSDMDNGERAVFKAEGATGNVNQGLQEAKANNEKYVDVPNQEEANTHAQNILKSYAEKFGDKEGNIPLDKWHQIASEQGKAFDRNASTAKNAAAKSVSNAAKKVIEKNTYHKDFYKRMQAEKRAIIKGQEINEMLNGKKIPHSKNFFRDLLKKGGGSLGIYLGDKIGGPLGAILGNLVGEHISKVADKRHGRNIFETKGMKAALKEIESKNPAVHAVLMREIQKASKGKFDRDMKRESVLKLPAPQGIPLGPRTGQNKSIVTGGKRPPIDFRQAENRKAGRPEYGGLHNYQKQVEALKKLTKPRR